MNQLITPYIMFEIDLENKIKFSSMMCHEMQSHKVGAAAC